MPASPASSCTPPTATCCKVAQAVTAEIGAGRVGIRISPAQNIQDVWKKHNTETRTTDEALITDLAPLSHAHLSVLHHDSASDRSQDLRRVIVNSGFSRMTTREEAVSSVAHGIADLVTVGRPPSPTRPRHTLGQGRRRKRGQSGHGLRPRRARLHGPTRSSRAETRDAPARRSFRQCPSYSKGGSAARRLQDRKPGHF